MRFSLHPKRTRFPAGEEGGRFAGDSPFLAEVDAFIEYCRTRRRRRIPRRDQCEHRSPAAGGQYREDRPLLKEARRFYKAQHYETRFPVEDIYLIVPYQRDAIQLMNDNLRKDLHGGLNRRWPMWREFTHRAYGSGWSRFFR
jgi:hypothetical protein